MNNDPGKITQKISVGALGRTGAVGIVPCADPVRRKGCRSKVPIGGNCAKSYRY
jgi:hypothetical protein